MKLNGIGVLRCRLGAIWLLRKLARLDVHKTLSPHEARLVAQWLSEGPARGPP